MSTTLFYKTAIAGLSCVALVLVATGVSAAPSLGMAKGRPYYGSANQQSGARAVGNYAPAFSTETRQSFSYEPAEGVAKVQGGCNQHAAAAPSAPKKDVAAAPQTTRRSFSYEPQVQPEPRARSYNRSAAPKKDPWLLPKGDPRRYSR